MPVAGVGCDPVEVTYRSAEELRRHMARFDPAVMCLCETSRGVPAGWLLAGHTKRSLAELLRRTYAGWDGDVALVFEAPPAGDEPEALENLSPRSRDALKLCDATHAGDLAAVSALLQRRVDVDGRVGRRGMNTALSLACRSGHVDAAKVLLEARAEVDGRNDFKETPLMCAANRARATVCRLLLEQGADVHLVDENGDNALDFLGAGGSERKRECREVLRRAGCQRR